MKYMRLKTFYFLLPKLQQIFGCQNLVTGKSTISGDFVGSICDALFFRVVHSNKNYIVIAIGNNALYAYCGDLFFSSNCSDISIVHSTFDQATIEFSPIEGDVKPVPFSELFIRCLRDRSLFRQREIELWGSRLFVISGDFILRFNNEGKVAQTYDASKGFETLEPTSGTPLLSLTPDEARILLSLC